MSFRVLFSSNQNVKYFDSLLFANCTFGVVLLVITEGISIIRRADYSGLLCTWGLLAVVLIVAILIGSIRNKISGKDLIQMIIPEGIVSRISVLQIVIILYVLLMAVLAVVTPPYNYDSMAYHLTRIAHWTQNKSVAHYYSTGLRQLASPALAEYVNFNIYVLMLRHDNLFNLLQLFSYFFSGIIIRKITGKLGGSRVYMNISMLIFYAVPIAFAESLNTQVDLFATVWMLVQLLKSKEKCSAVLKAVVMCAIPALLICL